MRYVIYSLLTLLLFSCEHYSFTSPSSKSLSVYTNKTEYLRPEQVIVTVQNGSGKSISLDVCDHSIVLHKDKWYGDHWELWGTTDCISAEPVEKQLDSDALLVDTVRVGKAGTYRFWFEFTNAEDSSQVQALYTNEFVIY